MTDERTPDRELTTADLAAGADRERERHADPRPDETVDREVAVPREARRADAPAGTDAPLVAPDVAETLRARWTEIQTGFVDEPRRAVEEADTLVAEAIRRLAESFAEARASLERDWSRGEDVSTEELRRTLQRYRAFFGRLLSL